MFYLLSGGDNLVIWFGILCVLYFFGVSFKISVVRFTSVRIFWLICMRLLLFLVLLLCIVVVCFIYLLMMLL